LGGGMAALDRRYRRKVAASAAAINPKIKGVAA
jgi:hypothetical protein